MLDYMETIYMQLLGLLIVNKKEKKMKNIIKTINETNRNFVFSPIAIYYALMLLAQTTAGETKQEILKAINVKEEELVEKSKELFKKLNINSEDGRLMLNSSLWFNNEFDFNQEYADKLAKDNNSTVRSGKMGTSEFDNQIHRWININTHNLLADKVQNIKTNTSEILELITTMYIKGSWVESFNRFETKFKKFNISKNEIVKCEFMSQYLRDNLYIGERFKALAMYLDGVGKMMFILPYDGFIPDDIKNDNDLVKLLNGRTDHLSKEYYLINFSVPKFDISADGDILEQLRKLGISKVMDMKQADFSPISTEQELYLSDARQASRLKINEDGVEAAAYVEMCVFVGCAPDFEQPKEIDFILDRPFMFSIIKDRTPMFVGTIVDPTK